MGRPVPHEERRPDAPELLFLQPVLDRQVLCKGIGGDQHVVGPDRCTLAPQVMAEPRAVVHQGLALQLVQTLDHQIVIHSLAMPVGNARFR